MEKVKIFLGSVKNTADKKCNAFLEENKGISIIESTFIPYRDKDEVFDHVIFIRYNDGKKKYEPSSVNNPVLIRPNDDYIVNPLLLIDDLSKIENKESKDAEYLINLFKEQCPYAASSSYSNSGCYSKDGYPPRKCTLTHCMYYKRVLEYFSKNNERKELK